MLEKLKNIYSKKIITTKSLNKIIGSRPRKLKVILCHGNFDVVHPGHVRHLIYAKSKADILVVSITADKFIQKGVYRPFVPENIRAINLAAFEMVDYVIIDKHKTSNEILKDLKQIGTSAEKITRRGERITEIELGEKIGSEDVTATSIPRALKK